MVGIFKANNPVNTFLLFIYGLFCKCYYFSLLPVPVTKRTDGIVYQDLLLGLQSVTRSSAIIYSIITYLLLFTQAVLFNRIINEYRLFQKATYLPAMSYLLITSLFPEWNILSSALVANTLLIWIWYKLNGLYDATSPKKSLFNTGFLIGICALIYFPSLVFALLIAIALIINRPFSLSEWVISIVGMLTPYYYLFVWLYLSGNTKFYKFPMLSFGVPWFQKNYWQWAAIALVLAAFLTGSFYVRANLTKQVVQISKGWTLIFFYLLLAVLVAFINDTHSFQNWILTAVPLSVFVAAAFFYPAKKWFPVLLHWIMATFVIIISYYHK